MIIQDVKFEGRVTTVLVTAHPDSIGEMLTPGEVGVGVARCRPEDHFEEEVGLAIATARAAKDLSEKGERAALALSMTEEGYQQEPIDVTVILPSGRRVYKRLPRVAAEALADLGTMLGARVDRDA